MAANALPAGHTLQEYRIEKLLGVGGFGLTYLAVDQNLGLKVALKEYLPGDIALRGPDQSIVPSSEDGTETFAWGKQRFLDEARTLASFRHPNIVRVMRFFETSGSAYMVMEFVEGSALSDWMRSRRPLDEARVAGLLGQAAAAEGVVVPVLLEVDIGMDRAGVLPGPPTLELARVVNATPGLAFLGLMGYEGHVLDLKPPEVKATACRQALDLLVESRDLLDRNGIRVQVVSAGGTGSYRLTAAHPGITEVQAGGGIFMDAMYQERLSVDDLGCALTILATVTSRHERHVVVDAGFKTMSAFHHPPRPLGREDLRLRYLSAEHGVWDIADGQRGPSVGERVEFLVGYGDSTNFLHDRFLGMRRGRVETVWPMLGRGKLS